jgi:hypothetical protein
MYWNFVAIDGVIKNQLNTQQDATLKGKNITEILIATDGLIFQCQFELNDTLRLLLFSLVVFQSPYSSLLPVARRSHRPPHFCRFINCL